MQVARGLIGACVVVMVAGLWCGTADAKGAEADIVLRSGKIYTVDKTRSIKQAIAFKGNTIVSVGTDADVAPLIGAATKIVDLKGKLVLPGLIDTHIHPIIGAINGAKCGLPRQGSRRRRRVVRGGAARQLRLLGDSQGHRPHRSQEAGRSLGQ